MNRAIRLITEGLALAIVIGGATVYGMQLFQGNGTVKIGAVSGQFQQYVATEREFKSRYLNYDGSCGDLALPSNVSCVATADTYKFEQSLSDGSVYCADSTGFAGQLSQPTAPGAQLCH